MHEFFCLACATWGASEDRLKRQCLDESGGVCHIRTAKELSESLAPVIEQALREIEA